MINNISQVDVIYSVTVAVFFYVIGLLYIFTIQHNQKNLLIKLFSLAFIVRFVALYSIYYYLISVGGDGFAISDDRQYDVIAKQIAYELSKGLPGFKEYGAGWVNIGYFNFNGFLYHYFGFDTLSARFVNVFLASLTVILFYRIMQELFDDGRAKVIAYTVIFLPSLIFWSVLELKDTAIIFCTISIIFIMICKLEKSLSLINISMYFLFMYILWHLRKDYTFPLMSVSLLWLLIRYTGLRSFFDNSKKSSIKKYSLLSIAGIAIIIAMLFTGLGSDFADNMVFYSEVQSGMANASSGFTRYLRIVSPSDIYKLPAAVAFTALAPLPSFMSLTDPVMAGFGIQSISNLVLIILFPYVILGFFCFKRDTIKFTDELLLRWLPLMTLIMLSILYMGNLRYKSTILIYFACWAGLALYDRKRLRTKLVLIYLGSFVSIMIILPIAIMFR